MLQLLLLREVAEAVPLVEVVGDEYGDDEYGDALEIEYEFDDAGEVVVASFVVARVAVVVAAAAIPYPRKEINHSHSC